MWLAGCTTPAPPQPSTLRLSASFPAEAFLTQRAVLTGRGRQFAFNGYLAFSQTRGMRLVLTGDFGQILADVLVKHDGSVHVMQSGKILHPNWIRHYVAEDLKCVFAESPARHGSLQVLSPSHFILRRPWYVLDISIVETRVGDQPPALFETNQVRKL
jgi:hypothetical protein